MVVPAVIGPTPYCAPRSFQYCEAPILVVKPVMLVASASPE